MREELCCCRLSFSFVLHCCLCIYFVDFDIRIGKDAVWLDHFVGVAPTLSLFDVAIPLRPYPPLTGNLGSQWHTPPSFLRSS